MNYPEKTLDFSGHLSSHKSSASSKKNQLSVGLLVDTPIVSKYVYDFVRWAEVHPHIKITHLILHGSTGEKSSALVRLISKIKRRGLYRAAGDVVSRVFFDLILRLERSRIKISKSKRHRDHLDEFDLSAIVKNTIRLTPVVSRSGLVLSLNAEDLSRVRELNCDLLLRAGSGILRGDFLNASKLGILSIHHGDNRSIRGGPAGFWEVYHRQETTGFSIQRLNEELDGGEVFVRGHFPTLHYFLLNQAVLFEKANWHLKRLVEKIAVNGKMPDALPSVPYPHRLYRAPRASEAIHYLVNSCGWFVRKKFAERFGATRDWTVAYCRSDWRNCVLWRNMKLENPPQHYLADPFIVSRDGKDFCFVEDFDWNRGKGDIAVYEIKEKGSVRVGTALNEKFHLSFPFLFEYRGEIFMCPETSENGDIRIYRCVEFPLRWKLEKVVMKEISAADTMFLEHGGKWWMFTNVDVTGCGDHCSELFIFSSDSPFGDTWISHLLNPVIVDASRARNGGLVRDGDILHRISQRQGFNFYGKETAINQIVELTDSTYVESPVSSITPTFADNIVGTHHFHSNGIVTVFDLKCRN